MIETLVQGSDIPSRVVDINIVRHKNMLFKLYFCLLQVDHATDVWNNPVGALAHQ